MLKYILTDIFRLTHTALLLEVVYYTIIMISLCVSAFLFHNRLLSLGYEKKQTRTFIVLSLVLSYPVGIISARMVGMFYFPPRFWSVDFFFNQLFYGKHVTFHAAIILPIIMMLCLTVIMRFKIAELWDAFFIYMPLGHAIGRMACLLVGCCWGRPVSLSVFGHTFEFDNPVPLYSIGCNIAIFLILRGFFNWIYSRKENRRYGGLVISLYLILYGNVRLLLELLRTTKIVFIGLTQAQIAMLGFIGGGAFLFVFVMLKNLMADINGKGMDGRKRAAFSLAGFFGYMVVVGMLYGFLSSRQIINWPFHSVHTVVEAYQTIVEYLPILFVSFFSMVWLRIAGIPAWPCFKWTRISGATILVGAIISVGYAVYMLKPVRFGLHVSSVWTPVVVLSLFNAVAEETVFRVVLYGLLRKLSENIFLCNFIQSLVYASIHIFIGGYLLALQAFVLGVILGWMREKNDSVVPCVICHFIVDLGAIGGPILAS